MPVYLNGDGWLVVGSRGEDLRLLGGDDRVAADELGHDASNSLNAQCQRVHVQ